MITKLRIQNFKAYRDQQFSLAPLTLLAGLNGSGKSSLLQSLLLLRQSYDQGILQQEPGRVALNEDLIRLGRFQEALFESADEPRISISFEDESEPDLNNSCAFTSAESDARTAVVENHSGYLYGPVSLFEPGFRFLGAERTGPRTQYAIPDREGPGDGVGTM